jgi:hypothetical protein
LTYCTTSLTCSTEPALNAVVSRHGLPGLPSPLSTGADTAVNGVPVRPQTVNWPPVGNWTAAVRPPSFGASAPV